MEGAIGTISRQRQATLRPLGGATGVAETEEDMDVAGPRPAVSDTAPSNPDREGDARSVEYHHRRELGRRGLNVLVAAFGIVLTAPLMLVIAGAIRLTSKGPVIYRQKRVGIDRRRDRTGPVTERRKSDSGGRLFTMYKFRTMYDGAHDPQVWARPDDPRVTPVGRILRAYRLDELPQLFNVLLGDMNVVGPRPEQPRIFTNLAERFTAYRMRQRVLPGITGMAQIHLPYDQSMDDVKRKVDKDLEYIQKKSFWTDVKIMASTVRVLFFRRGSL